MASVETSVESVEEVAETAPTGAPFADARPPKPPWRDLSPLTSAGGFLSFYLPDGLSAFPIRAVTLPANNKSDPNLETRTYGLFSTCAHAMRASIVARRCPYIFFLTRQNSQRVLTGYYRLRWYAPGTLQRRPPDFALAADEIQFIYPAVTIVKLPTSIRSVVAKPFRLFKKVDSETATRLVDFLRSRPDRTADYLAEIERLERFNKYHTGFRYAGGWKRIQPFGWDTAGEYLKPKPATGGDGPPQSANASPSSSWRCQECKAVVHHKALLKRCSNCGAMGSLVAAAD